ncbi:hypothetical protein BJX76DRAFT_343237 [Aspergillus varians]
MGRDILSRLSDLQNDTKQLKEKDVERTAAIKLLEEKDVAKTKTLQQHRASIEQLQERVLPMRLLRETVLDQQALFTSANSAKLRNDRNAAAHGGNIVEDVLAIEAETFDERIVAWRRSFRDIYGFQYSRVACCVHHAPPQVIEAFNIHGNCVLLAGWKQDPGRGNTIRDKCRTLVLPWVQENQPDGYSSSSAHLLEEIHANCDSC